MVINSCVKFCHSLRLHQLDPAYECFINALKCTVPAVVGAFLWIYMRRPFTFFIILLPVFSMLTMNIFPTFKLKFRNLFVLLFLIAVLQFISAILHYHYSILIAALFIISFSFIASIKYRYVSIFALLCITIYLELTPGWYAGTNRLIEILIVGIIVVILQFCFEYCTSIFRMRAAMLYFFEIIADAFYAFTADDENNVDIKIRNKYLFERPLSFKADFAIEKIYKSNSEKFIHRILMELINKGKIINDEEFYFRKNKDYRDFVYPMFILTKRMFRDVTFMLRFHKYENKIHELLPTTKILILYINQTLKDIISSFRAEKKDLRTLNVLEDECVENWLKEHDNIKSSNCIGIEKEVLEFIYGLKCMINDIRGLAAIINNREETAE
jgi:hypothetical protein